MKYPEKWIDKKIRLVCAIKNLAEWYDEKDMDLLDCFITDVVSAYKLNLDCALDCFFDLWDKREMR